MALAYPDTVMDLPRSLSVENCYLENRDSVFRWCLRYAGGRRDLAEDATQEVFVKLLQNIDRLEGPDHVRPWLYRVAANVSVSRMRRDRVALRMLQRILLDDREPEVASVDELFDDQQVAAQAMRQLQQLPVKQRVVVCMKLLDGLSQKQIADSLELSEGYVSKLLASAWNTLANAGWEVGP